MPEAPQDADERDRRLLAAYADGDGEAFAALVQAHADRLWPVALRLCGWNASDAEDALQDAFISAMRNAGSFRGEAKVSTWLHRIVVNACLDRLRRRQRRPESELLDEAFLIADPRDRFGERELAMEIERGLAALPDEQRAAVVLVDVAGWPVAEAAQALGVPTGTVKSRAARGRAKLALELGHLRNRTGNRGVEDGVQGTGGGGGA